MTKLAALFTIVALVLTMSLLTSSEARPTIATSVKIVNPVPEETVNGDICDERNPDEDCLFRRTLTAHTDYIYTETKPKRE
ncbi:phytosulfokines-like [Momordica charantia]|uniref:Phytosulfokine n=1 Tax=Momordica charantia TaxID=3673 RepID=A0A6J1BSJ0_MOMCH|nr:phytosulfokines-like [Momordica charantia]